MGKRGLVGRRASNDLAPVARRFALDFIAGFAHRIVLPGQSQCCSAHTRRQIGGRVQTRLGTRGRGQ